MCAYWIKYSNICLYHFHFGKWNKAKASGLYFGLHNWQKCTRNQSLPTAETLKYKLFVIWTHVTFSFGYNIVSIRNMSIYFLEQTGMLHNSNLWYANETSHETSLGSFRSSLLCTVFSSLPCPSAVNLEIHLGASSRRCPRRGTRKGCTNGTLLKQFPTSLTHRCGVFVHILFKLGFRFCSFTVTFQRSEN